jgi:hypothetical protein
VAVWIDDQRDGPDAVGQVLKGNPGTTIPPSSVAFLQLARMSLTWTWTTPLNPLILPSARRSVPIAVPPETISTARSVPWSGVNCQSKRLP